MMLIDIIAQLDPKPTDMAESVPAKYVLSFFYENGKTEEIRVSDTIIHNDDCFKIKESSIEFLTTALDKAIKNPYWYTE